LINSKKVFLFIILTVALAACKTALPAFDEKEIIGTWVSVNDKNSMMKFTSDEAAFSYTGYPDSSYEYEISEGTCDSAYYNGSESNVHFLRLYNDNEKFCYEITALNKKNLALMYSQNGKVQLYKKQKR
jgi:hypothetical protein